MWQSYLAARGSLPWPPRQIALDPIGLAASGFTVWFGGPSIVVFTAGLFVDVALRSVIGTIVLAWMGMTCLLNARRCRRTHCRFTGPFYLIMILPVLAAGLGLVPIGTCEWGLLAAAIVAGCKFIWWATERAWGKFS